jgi:hypothetical protein
MMNEGGACALLLCRNAGTMVSVVERLSRPRGAQVYTTEAVYCPELQTQTPDGQVHPRAVPLSATVALHHDA